MPNHTFVDEDGIIQQFMEGDQDTETVGELIDDTLKQTDELKLKNPSSKLLFLVDMSGIGKHTLASRQAGFTAMKKFPFDKIAIYTTNRVIKHITSLFIMASGHGSDVKQFSDKSKAKEWLLQKS